MAEKLLAYSNEQFVLNRELSYQIYQILPSPSDPLHQRLQRFRCLPSQFRLLSGGASQFPGGTSPAVDQRLFTAHAKEGLADKPVSVRVINPVRQATVRRDLRRFHRAQRVDLPQTLAHQVVAKAPHRAQCPVQGRLGSKTRAARDVACDHLGINVFDPNPWSTSLEPASPAIQPCLRVRR